jgi:hypothetical protein
MQPFVADTDAVGRSHRDPLGKNAYTDFESHPLSSGMSETITTRAPHSKSVVRSIRLDEDIDKSLQKYSLKEGISLNSLINKALLRYVRWDASASRFGGVTLAGPSLTKLMSYLSDDEVRDYASWVAENSVRDLVTFFFGEFTIQTLLKSLRLLADYGGHFKYEESTSGRVTTAVLKHGRGAKLSIFYQEWVRIAIEKLLGLKIETERTENLVSFRIPLTTNVEQKG